MDVLKNDRLNDWSENDERWILDDKKFQAQIFLSAIFQVDFLSMEWVFSIIN